MKLSIIFFTVLLSFNSQAVASTDVICNESGIDNNVLAVKYSVTNNVTSVDIHFMDAQGNLILQDSYNTPDSDIKVMEATSKNNENFVTIYVVSYTDDDEVVTRALICYPSPL